MRIISGTHKGRRIVAPKNLPVRPTTDLAKEGLFNILTNHFDLPHLTGGHPSGWQDIKVLDLFAGTGNITYEFASRGCKEITSVDINYKCVQFIKRTIAVLGFQNINIIKKDAFKYLTHCKNSFGIIFADPPYELKDVELVAELAFENRLLSNGGWLIIEHKKEINFSKHKCFLEKRRYGEVNFSIFTG